MIESMESSSLGDDFNEMHLKALQSRTSMQSQLIDLIAEELGRTPQNLDFSLSFVEHGGHSLAAVRLCQQCRIHRINMTLPAILRATSVQALVDDASKSDCAAEGNPTGKAVRYPMTEMQLSLLYGSQARTGTNIIKYGFFFAVSSLERMRAAWKAVLESEPIFRTRFIIEDGEGWLEETSVTPFSWEILNKDIGVKDFAPRDLAEINEGYPTRSFQIFLDHNLDQNKTGAKIVWTVHHALIDGHSMSILLSKVEFALSGITVPQGDSFARFARELRDYQEANSTLGESFWHASSQTVASTASSLRRPPSGATSSQEGPYILRRNIPHEMVTKIAQCYGVTSASVYIGAWAILCGRYFDCDAVRFGVVFSGRHLPLEGIASVVGPLINMLPFSISVDEKYGPAEFLSTVFRALVETSEYAWTTPAHGFNRKVGSSITIQSQTLELNHETGYVTSDLRAPCMSVVSDIPLNCIVEPCGRLQLQVSETANPQELAGSIVRDYYCILEFLQQRTEDISFCLSSLASLESRELLRLGNNQSALNRATSVQEDLVDLFYKTSIDYPQLIAVEKAGESITYERLFLRAEHIARHIRPLVRPGDVVCVHADQSINWIVAVYGVLLANGVYCPLNPNLTKELRAAVFKTSGARVFLVPHAADIDLAPTACRNAVIVESVVATLRYHKQESVFKGGLDPSRNAYLCFTSGSTGKPKGVLCTHRGLVAFQRDPEVRLFARPGQRIAQTMSVSFDGSIHEIFSALSYGATLILPDSENPFEHLQRVDAAVLTPSIANVLDPAEYPTLSRVYLVGEPVSQRVNDVWSRRKAWNMYGPTEATGGATIKRLFPGEPVTIGRPNPSSRAYILDRHQRLSPKGAVGELFLAGVQVANGYLDRPEATAERFFDDPFMPGLGEMMYKTGDLAYWNADGEIACLGRTDRQIKLRGFRMELDDLEIRLCRLPGVTAAAVAVHDDYLVAMVRPSTIDVNLLRISMPQALPAHTIPRHVEAVDEFPTTSAGKLDYKKMASLVVNALRLRGVQESAVVGELELGVASVWRKVLSLRCEQILSPSSNFISLGGDSLRQLRLASQLTSLYRRHIPLRLVIDAPILRDFAEELRRFLVQQPNSQQPPPSPSNPAFAEGWVSPIESEWASKYLRASSTTAFNVSFACLLDQTVDLQRLASAWNTALRGFPVLRSYYQADGESHWKRYLAASPSQVQHDPTIDLIQELNRPFDIGAESPIRVLLSDNLLLVVISHIVCDLPSLQLLLDVVSCLYAGREVSSTTPAYVDALTWQYRSPQSDLAFWRKQYSSAAARLSNKPITMPRQSDAYCGTSRVFVLSSTVVRAMMSLTALGSLSFQQLCMAAVGLALQRSKDVTNIVLAMPHMNRRSGRDLETFGLFLEPLPVIINHPSIDTDAEPVATYLETVQSACQAALTHALPWHELMNLLKEIPGAAERSVFEAMVTYHGLCNAPKLDVNGAEPVFTYSNGSKFAVMCEFTQVQEDVVVLRIEHDNSILSQKSATALAVTVAEAIRLLAAGKRHDELKVELQRTTEHESKAHIQELDDFDILGRRFSDIRFSNTFSG